MINHKMLKSHKSWARSLGGEVFLGGSFASENISVKLCHLCDAPCEASSKSWAFTRDVTPSPARTIQCMRGGRSVMEALQGLNPPA
jgi:hypothetical protein